ncbi:MAG: HEAT repeat domain-containing protein [Lentisphaeria bacterium]|nr:HEAT repeat domain-containing protein [Lentisphaeria bacterium]NQZ66470.1 HEAT repeat domain-containing protein [Lentisphaeria bacterium]
MIKRIYIAVFLLATLSYAKSVEEMSTKELVAKIVEYSDGDELINIHVFIREGSGRGAAGITEALNFLNPDKKKRSKNLYEMIQGCAKIRRNPEQIVKLYDPQSHALYYGANALKAQTPIVTAFTWKVWPYHFPRAAVRAAPLATLAWLKKQIAAAKPQTEKLLMILTEWNHWISYKNERQYTSQYGKLLGDVAKHPVLSKHKLISNAILGGLGECKAIDQIAYVRAKLKDEHAEIRGRACMTLASFGTDAALTSLIELSKTETNANTQKSLGSTFTSFPASEKAGAAALALFKRTKSQNARREILFLLSTTSWSQRNAFIEEAFKYPGNGVLGVALLAVNKRVPDKVRDDILKLCDQVENPTPELIDAIGKLGDEKGLVSLAKWFDSEKNWSIRNKIVLAVEMIKGPKASQTTQVFMKKEANKFVIHQIIRVAGRLKIKALIPDMIRVAGDPKSPIDMRSEAVWALGHLGGAEAYKCLTLLSENKSAFIEDDVPKDQPVESGALEQARLYVQLSLMNLGSSDAAKTVEKIYHTGTPTTKLTVLIILSDLNKDSHLIKDAFQSTDFVVLLGAVRAAWTISPLKYKAAFDALRQDPYLAEMLKTSYKDVTTLVYYLTQKKETAL